MPQPITNLEGNLVEARLDDLSGDLSDENLERRQPAFICIPPPMTVR